MDHACTVALLVVLRKRSRIAEPLAACQAVVKADQEGN
jgi:hypothetical protein